MTEISTGSRPAYRRDLHALWGAERRDSGYLRKLGSDMHAYQQRHQGDVAVLRSAGEREQLRAH